MSTKTAIRDIPRTKESLKDYFPFSPYVGAPNVKDAEITAFAKLSGPLDAGGRVYIRPPGS